MKDFNSITIEISHGKQLSHKIIFFRAYSSKEFAS